METMHLDTILGLLGGGLTAYLLGAIPFGWLIARWKGVDIRTVGSGNIGATNVFRTVGKGWGVLTFALDAGKGFLPAWAWPRILHDGFHCPVSAGAALLFACLAIVGHNFPIYLRFKGGKGVATSAGALIGVAPAAAAIGGAVWVLILLVSRYVSVASMAAAIGVAAAAWWLYSDDGMTRPMVLTALGALIIWRHRANLRRLRQGTEHRFRSAR